MAVVKADGYGHGLAEVARAAAGWGCDWLGVGNVSEGLALREAGIETPSLVLAPALAREVDAAARAGLTLTAGDPEALAPLAAAAQRSGRVPVSVHLLVDVGMARFGVQPQMLPALAREAMRFEAIRIGGVYTHFAEPLSVQRTREDLRIFLNAVDSVQQELGQAFPIVHAAGSEAAVTVPESRLDMVRIGNVMYGYWPVPQSQFPQLEGKELGPIWTLRAKVVAVRDLARGHGLGYGQNRTARAMRIAVLPVGVSGGVGLRSVQAGAGPGAVVSLLARELVRSVLPRWRPRAYIRGAAAPFVGRVGMQFTLVEVTGIPGVEVGDEAIMPAVRATAAAGLPRVYIS
jgi:alanine racemase